MPELPNFYDADAVVEWVHESLPTEDWEILKADLVVNGYQGLVDWFDPLTLEQRQSSVADTQSRAAVVQWLSAPAVAEDAPLADYEPALDGYGTTDVPATEVAGGTGQYTEEPADTAAGALGAGTWDEARKAWIFYDPVQGWLTADGRPVAEADADAAAQPATEQSPAEQAPSADYADAPVSSEAPAVADEPPADTPPDQPVLAELPETTQTMVDEAIDEEIAPVFDEAFSSIEGLDQLSPEDLREVLAAALAESGVGQ